MSMAVAGIIDLPGGCPPALRVMVDGYEEGYNDLSHECMIVKRNHLDTGTGSWQERHDDPEGLPCGKPDAAGTVEALVLRRSSW